MAYPACLLNRGRFLAAARGEWAKYFVLASYRTRVIVPREKQGETSSRRFQAFTHFPTVMRVVSQTAKRAGLGDLVPHDLRQPPLSLRLSIHSAQSHCGPREGDHQQADAYHRGAKHGHHGGGYASTSGACKCRSHTALRPSYRRGAAASSD